MSHFLADVKNLKGLVPKKKAERAGAMVYQSKEKRSSHKTVKEVAEFFQIRSICEEVRKLVSPAGTMTLLSLVVIFGGGAFFSSM